MYTDIGASEMFEYKQVVLKQYYRLLSTNSFIWRRRVQVLRARDDYSIFITLSCRKRSSLGILRYEKLPGRPNIITTVRVSIYFIPNLHPKVHKADVTQKTFYFWF